MKNINFKRTLSGVLALLCMASAASVSGAFGVIGANAEEDEASVPVAAESPVWKWAEDYSAAYAFFGTIEVEAEVTVDKQIYASFENEGLYVYTATAVFEGKTYTDVKESVIPMNSLAHYEAVEPSCETDGQMEFWWDLDTLIFYADPEGTVVTDIFAITLPALGHDYSDCAVWDWSEDYTSAVFTGVCGRCGETVTAEAEVSSVTVEPTETKDGKTTYTATVMFGDQVYSDVKEVTIPKLSSEASEAPVVSYTAGKGRVKLSWTAVEGAEKYAVYGFVGGKWTALAQGTGTSYIMNDLEAGKNYKVAVAVKANGKWNFDPASVITVTPKENTAAYPVVQAQVKGGQFKLRWTAAENAEKYCIAVKDEDGKWTVIKKNIPADVLTYTSPANNTPLGSYKVAVAAYVNGKLDLTNIDDRAVEINIALPVADR